MQSKDFFYILKNEGKIRYINNKIRAYQKLNLLSLLCLVIYYV